MSTIRSQEDRVQWLVDFAYRDLGKFREGDWLNLRDDLAAFFGKSLNVSPTVLGSRAAVDYVKTGATSDWFGKLQRQVRAMLRSRFSERSYPDIEDDAVELPSRYVLTGYQGWTLMELVSEKGAESAEREILFVASLALATTDSARIQLCPSCEQRLFWRKGRQKYCSDKCRHHESYQAWLERQGSD